MIPQDENNVLCRVSVVVSSDEVLKGCIVTGVNFVIKIVGYQFTGKLIAFRDPVCHSVKVCKGNQLHLRSKVNGSHLVEVFKSIVVKVIVSSHVDKN